MPKLKTRWTFEYDKGLGESGVHQNTYPTIFEVVNAAAHFLEYCAHNGNFPSVNLIRLESRE